MIPRHVLHFVRPQAPEGGRFCSSRGASCLAGIFGYFISLSAVDHARRWALLVAGLVTLVPRSPLWGVVVEASTFFLLLTTYLLKARGHRRRPS